MLKEEAARAMATSVTRVSLAVVLALALGAATNAALQNGADAFWVPLDPPAAHYGIDAEVDIVHATVRGSETIRFRNTAKHPLCRLALDWPWNQQSRLEVTTNGRPTRLLVQAGQMQQPPPLLLQLPEPLLPDKSVELSIKFAKSLTVSPGEEKITLTNWYPRLWWGFATDDDYEVRVQSPAGYELGTSGVFDEKAGSYRVVGARSFGLFLGKGMLVTETRLEGVLIRAFFTPRSETCASFLLQTATDVIAFYKQRFGFYPYRSLTIIPGFDEPVGGYNPATAIVAIHGQEKMADRPEMFWKWITAHEIGHQYWGEYVLEKDDPGWVWIGMGIYTDREYFRAKGLSLDQHKEVMSRYVTGVRNHLDTTVAVTRDQLDDIEFDFNNVVTHGKGFSIVSALSAVVGHDTFERVQLHCLKGFAGRRLGLAELRPVAELESGQDLGWFFSQWAQSNRFLAYDIASQESSKAGEQYVTKVIVHRLGSMTMPVPVKALFVDGTEQVKITDRLLDQSTLQFTSTAPLKQVQLDPETDLAMVLPLPGPPPLPTTEEALRKRIRRLGRPGSREDSLPLFQATKEVKLTDAFSWFKLGMALYDGRHLQEALDSFRQAAHIAGDGDASGIKFGALVWQGHMLDLLGDRTQALQCYREALARSADFSIRHDQYGITLDRKWVEERIASPFQQR